MVLAGTALTALVAFYIFPYDWSFNLAMTIGSILSATDPVAVSALLEEVGAPPRLKVHVSGESLFNDGACGLSPFLDLSLLLLLLFIYNSYLYRYVPLYSPTIHRFGHGLLYHLLRFMAP